MARALLANDRVSGCRPEASHRKIEVHNESEPDSARQVGKRAKWREARYSVRPVLCLRVEFLTGSQCSNWGSLALDPIKWLDVSFKE